MSTNSSHKQDKQNHACEHAQRARYNAKPRADIGVILNHCGQLQPTIKTSPFSRCRCSRPLARSKTVGQFGGRYELLNSKKEFILMSSFNNHTDEGQRRKGGRGLRDEASLRMRPRRSAISKSNNSDNNNNNSPKRLSCFNRNNGANNNNSTRFQLQTTKRNYSLANNLRLSLSNQVSQVSNGTTLTSQPKLTPASKSYTCFGCNQLIKDKFLLEACDNYWHENCLKCDRCQTKLGELGSTLYRKSEMNLCRQDYIEMFGRTAICEVCEKLIYASEMVMRAKQNVYHLECFACQLCGQRFCIGDRFYLFENKIVCQFDYEEHILPIQKTLSYEQPQTISIDRNTIGTNTNEHLVLLENSGYTHTDSTTTTPQQRQQSVAYQNNELVPGDIGSLPYDNAITLPTYKCLQGQVSNETQVTRTDARCASKGDSLESKQLQHRIGSDIVKSSQPKEDPMGQEQGQFRFECGEQIMVAPNDRQQIAVAVATSEKRVEQSEHSIAGDGGSQLSLMAAAKVDSGGELKQSFVPLTNALANDAKLDDLSCKPMKQVTEEPPDNKQQAVEEQANGGKVATSGREQA